MPKGMTEYFYANQIRIFDYPKWAEALRDAIRENMERIAAENGIEIEFVRSKKSFRKEQRVVWKLGRLLVAPSLLTEWYWSGRHHEPPVFFNGRDFPSADNVGRG